MSKKVPCFMYHVRWKRGSFFLPSFPLLGAAPTSSCLRRTNFPLGWDPKVSYLALDAKSPRRRAQYSKVALSATRIFQTQIPNPNPDPHYLSLFFLSFFPLESIRSDASACPRCICQGWLVSGLPFPFSFFSLYVLTDWSIGGFRWDRKHERYGRAVGFRCDL